MRKLAVPLLCGLAVNVQAMDEQAVRAELKSLKQRIAQLEKMLDESVLPPMNLS